MTAPPAKDDRKLVYVHDPMCSWCWGFSPSWRELSAALPPSLQVIRLLGGLAPDSDKPMPQQMQEYLQQTWHHIQSIIPGTEFNFGFWTACRPRRSTWPACRAVIAARNQGERYDEAMTAAIQRAYYLEAKNPSDDETLIELAGELELDTAQFSQDLNSEGTRHRLQQEITAARQLGVTGFPSLVLVDGNTARPIRIDYGDVESMLASVGSD